MIYVRTLAFASLLAVANAPLSARASTYTWDGGGTDDFWSDHNNWTNGNAPPSSVDTALVFAGTTGLTSNQDGGVFTLNALSFDGSAGAFVLSGKALNFSASSAGTLPTLTQNSASAETINNALTLANNLTVGGTGAGTLTLGGALSGAGSLTMAGSGTTLLTGANTYTGGTTLAAGTLSLGSSGALGSSGTLSFTGGTLQFSSANTTDYSGRFSTADNQAYSIDTNGQNVTFAKALTSSGGSLTKLGSGTLTLTGASTYTGDTTVQAGTLAVGSGGSVTGGNVNVGTGAALAISGSGSVRPGANAYLTVDGTMTLADTGSLSTGEADIGAGGTGTFKQSGGTFSTNGNLLRVGVDLGTGTYTLSGTGSLSTGEADIGNAGTGTFTQNGGTFTTNGNLLAIGSTQIGVTTHGSYNLNGGSLSTGEADLGSYLDSTATFTQSGGTFTTNGNALIVGVENYFSARVTYQLDGGTLTVGSVGNEGGKGTFNFNGGTLQAGASSTSFFQGLPTANVQAGGALIDTNGFNVTVAQNLVHDTTGGTAATDGGLTKLGTGTLTLSGANTYTGPTTVNAGTLQAGVATVAGTSGAFGVNSAVTLANTAGTTLDLDGFNTQIGSLTGGGTTGGNVTLGSATLTVGADNTSPAAFAGVISGTGGLTKIGAGTLTLTGTNTFTGPLNIDAGTVAVAGESNLGGGSVVSVGGGGKLLFTGSATLSRTYNLGFSTLSAAAGNTLTYASGASVNGGFLGAGGTQAFGNGSALSGTTATPGSVLTTNGAVSFTSATLRGAVTQSSGTLTASGTTFSSAATLTVGGTVNTNGVEIDGLMTINSGGTVANSGSSLVLGGGSRTTVNSGGTLSTDTSVSGSTIELNGGLLTNNGTQTGTLDVNYGSTLKGSGSFGTVNVTDGGKFSPGNSPGTAKVSSLNLESAGSYQFELTSATGANNDPGNDADLINVDNKLTISAGTTANSRFTVAIVSLDSNDNPAALTDFDASKSYRFVLATSAGIVGFNPSEFAVDTSGFANNLDGGNFSVVQDGNNLDLLFSPVPEPSTYLFVAIAMLAGAAVNRWKLRLVTRTPCQRIEAL